MSRAEVSDGPVPAVVGVAAVLYEAGAAARVFVKELKLVGRDVADAEQACAAGVEDGFHGSPGGPVVGGQADPLRGAVEQIGIEGLDAEVSERASEGLLDLDGDWGLRIVGQAMVLSALKGELGLQKKVGARVEAARNCCGDCLTDRGFVVMAALIGCVYA